LLTESDPNFSTKKFGKSIVSTHLQSKKPLVDVPRITENFSHIMRSKSELTS